MQISQTTYDVIIIGGSYSGLSAAMALGRSLRSVLIIDSGKPCNHQTPFSHNFITHDGSTPSEISATAKAQVLNYPSVQWLNDLAVQAEKKDEVFEVHTVAGKSFTAKMLHLATGVRDLFPDISGFAECWGISVLHCPFCHGYEVKGEKTVLLAHGEAAWRMAIMLLNWTPNLTLLTNGPSALNDEQEKQLTLRNVKIKQKEVLSLDQSQGHLKRINFKDNTTTDVSVMYAHVPFELHTTIPTDLGCELSDDGYVKVDEMQKTSIEGLYASGDCTTRTRTIAEAVAGGNRAGINILRSLIFAPAH